MKEIMPLELSWMDSSLEVDLDDRFSLRIGSRTKAQTLKTSSLQKGVILTCDGREIVDEGMGFGVPVIKYRDSMYYSKDAEMNRSNKRNVVRKIFRMNGVERVRVGNLGKIEFPSPAVRFLAGAYRSSNFLGKKIAQVDQALRKHVDIETEFVAVKERGEVSVTYEISSHRIHVECDLTHLEKDALQKIFILNEQGSSFFRQYRDSDGLHLTHGEIGAWTRVKAKSACLSDDKSMFAFCLSGLEGMTMWRGREDHADLSWSGLIYESSSKAEIMDYDISLNY